MKGVVSMSTVKEKIMPYAAGMVGAAATVGLMALGKEIADVYFQLSTGLEPSSIGQLYHSLPTWAKIAGPIELSAFPLMVGYGSKKAYEAKREPVGPQESQSLE